MKARHETLSLGNIVEASFVQSPSLIRRDEFETVLALHVLGVEVHILMPGSECEIHEATPGEWAILQTLGYKKLHLAISLEMAEVYYRQGIVLFKQGDFEPALESFNYALAIHPRYGDAYYSRGNVYSTLIKRLPYITAELVDGKTVSVYDPQAKPFFEKAIQDYTMAIEVDPDILAYGMRGEMYYMLGLRDLARKDFEAAANEGDEISKRILRERFDTG